MTRTQNDAILVAIDTSRRGGSVCAAAIGSNDADGIPGSDKWRTLDPDRPAATTLAPTFKTMLSDSGLVVTKSGAAAAIGGIAVAIGPGSFTGLRVAVTTAKTLAFAWNVPAVGIDSLTAIAADYFASHPETPSLAVICKAYRGQSYVANFTVQTCHDEATEMIDNDAVTAFLDRFNPAVILSDRAEIASSRPIADEVVAARGVWLAAKRKFAAGQTVDPMSLRPNYFRPSAAEEQRAAER